MAGQTKFDICSRALIQVGGARIADFDGGSIESETAALEYEPAVEKQLSAYRWRFASDQRKLSLLADKPLARWSLAYQLPADMLLLHGVTHLDGPIAYDRYGDKLFTDHDADVIADITFRADEALWPGYFADAMVAELLVSFARSIAREGEGQIKEKRKDAEKTWAVARNSDAQQQPGRRIAPSRLVSVRR